MLFNCLKRFILVFRYFCRSTLVLIELKVAIVTTTVNGTKVLSAKMIPDITGDLCLGNFLVLLFFSARKS